MKKGVLVVFFMLIISAGILGAKIDKDIEKELDEKGKARVIIKDDSLKAFGDERYVREINREEFRDLKKRKEIRIEYDYKVKALLQDSLPIINATITQLIQKNDINITGHGETICLLDSGMNYSNPDLEGVYMTGQDYVNQDYEPLDDAGHGTHVAGIIHGVAPDAKIIALKVLNETGIGLTSHVIDGIEWCTENSGAYNITVISMSLGDSLYQTYCDDERTFYRDAINEAVAKNITVVAATGNQGSTTKIAAPACIKEVIAVGGTTKNDGIYSNGNRNAITDLLAPAVNINSTWLSGYAIGQGTSMAAPHVTGATALINGLFKLNNIGMDPEEIKEKLNETGKRISDSGRTFSRINVYEAVKGLIKERFIVRIEEPLNKSYDKNESLELNFSITNLIDLDSKWYNIDENYTNVSLENNFMFDTEEGNHVIRIYGNDTIGNEKDDRIDFKVDVTEPKIKLYGENNSLEETNPISFDYEVVEENLVNCSLYGNWGGWHMNQSNQGENFSLSLQDGTFIWNVECIDESGNRNFNETNLTTRVDTEAPRITINKPENITYDHNIVPYSHTIIEEDLDSIWRSVDGVNESSNGNMDLTEGDHHLRVYANDSYGKENFEEVWFYVDLTNPVVELMGPESGNSKDIDFRYNVTDHEIDNCSLYIDGELNKTDKSVRVNETESIKIKLQNGNYEWKIKCRDKANREGTSEEWDIKIIYTENQDTGDDSSEARGSKSTIATGETSAATTALELPETAEEGIVEKEKSEEKKEDEKVTMEKPKKPYQTTIIVAAIILGTVGIGYWFLRKEKLEL